MQKISLLMTLAIVTVLGGSVWAQDESKDDAKKKDSNLEMAIEMTQTIMGKMFEKAELSDEQESKIDSILSEHVRDLVIKRQQLQTFLSSDEKATYNAALKLARKARYDNDKAEAYALKKLKLADDRNSAYANLSKLVKKINDDMMAKIGAVLTDEQKAKVPMFNTAKKGTEVKAGKDKDKGGAAKGSETKGSETKGSETKKPAPAAGSEKK